MGGGLAGRKLKNQTEVLIAAAAYSASFQTQQSWLSAQFDDILLVCNCTAVAGGGTATISYQVSLDGGTTWVTLATMTVVTGAGVTTKAIASPIGSLARLDVAIAGTSVTFELRADYHLSG